MVGAKQPVPVFLSVDEADRHCQAGASIWKFASTDDGLDPDVVLVGIGCELMAEVVAAAAILRRTCPALRMRVVNVTDLMILEAETRHPHSMTRQDFESLFTADRPIHFNYHGYVNEIRGLLFGRPNLERVTVECYKEEGSTTTPFDMLLRNCVSRYHVMEAAIRGGARRNQAVALDMAGMLAESRHQIKKIQEYIVERGKGEMLPRLVRDLDCSWLTGNTDPEGTFDLPKFDGTVFERSTSAKAPGQGPTEGFFVN